jgi:hypothetical protein
MEKTFFVESEWHYKTMAEYGFVPETKQQNGFVRRYVYRHPDGRTIICGTGVNSDYWEIENKRNSWDSLENYLQAGNHS